MASSESGINSFSSHGFPRGLAETQSVVCLRLREHRPPLLLCARPVGFFLSRPHSWPIWCLSALSQEKLVASVWYSNFLKTQRSQLSRGRAVGPHPDPGSLPEFSKGTAPVGLVVTSPTYSVRRFFSEHLETIEKQKRKNKLTNQLSADPLLTFWFISFLPSHTTDIFC